MTGQEGGKSTRHEQAIALAEDILADLELGRIPLSNVAMKCARLARLTGDEPALRWLLLEIGGYAGKLDEKGFQFAWEAGRGLQETFDKPYPERKVWPDSIATMEATTETLREELSHLVIPPLTEGSPASGGVLAVPGAGLGAVVDKFFSRRSSASGQIERNSRILAAVRRSIYSWALGRYHLLRFVDIPADVFQSAKVLVDNQLASVSPDALQKFNAAQERALSGSSEEWAQAAVSLRRMMKDVADALYPAKAELVDGHQVDDEHFVNRLWQFVRERASSDRGAILGAEVQYIGRRIDSLYELACKGTHSAVTREEVELAVVHLYLLLADLLSMLAPEELAALRGTNRHGAAGQGSTGRSS